MASCFEAPGWQRVTLFQAPQLTTAHKLLGTAAVLGFLFILLHPVTVTVLVTLLADGAAWGTPAWSMNITGYLAGAGFAFLCRDASNKPISEGGQEKMWILIWSAIDHVLHPRAGRPHADRRSRDQGHLSNPDGPDALCEHRQ